MFIGIVLLLVSLTTRHYNSAVMLDWSLVLAIATFSLAGAAFWAIWQTRKLQERERTDRLLNEIIEWAQDILECVPEVIIPPTSIKSKDTMLGLILINLVSKYKNVDARTEYVKGIASIFGESLKPAVEIVGQQLSEVIKFVLSHPPDERSYDMVGGYLEPLSTSTVALIKTATKIKTKDIS